MREQFFLAAAAQNIKRLVRFLSQPITPAGSHRLADREEYSPAVIAPKKTFRSGTFSTPTLDYTQNPPSDTNLCPIHRNSATLSVRSSPS